MKTAKAFEDREWPGDWRVEWVDDDGGVEVAIFSGGQCAGAGGSATQVGEGDGLEEARPGPTAKNPSHDGSGFLTRLDEIGYDLCFDKSFLKAAHLAATGGDP